MRLRGHLGTYPWRRLLPIIGLTCLAIWSLGRLTNELPTVDDFWRILHQGSLGWLVYLGAFFTANLLRALRWHYIITPHVTVSRQCAWLNFQWLFMIKSLMPWMSGDLLRSFWLRSRGGSGTYGLGVIVFERITDLVVLLCGGVILLLSCFFEPEQGTLGLCVASGALFVCLILFFSQGDWFFSCLARISRSFPRIEHLLHNRLEALNTLMRKDLSASRRLVVFSMTVGIWVLLVLGMACLLESLDHMDHWGEPLSYILAINLVGVLSPLPGNLGSYQLAGSGVLLFYGMNVADAVVIPVVLHILILLLTSILGVACLAIVGGNSPKALLAMKGSRII